MAVKLSDLIILSDIDGTLIQYPDPIHPRNIEAIKRFTEKGGHFAIASGRAAESARPYAGQLAVNTPCVVFNGAGIYDYQAERLLYASYLPPDFISYIKRILAQFPTCGAFAINHKIYECVAQSDFSKELIRAETVDMVNTDLEALCGDYFKIIFTNRPDVIIEMDQFVRMQEWAGVSFVRSSQHFLEMLPLDANKGTGLLKLAEIMGLPRENTIAIGDYYNDYEMLKTAGFSVAVGNAPDDIKEICNLVTGPCSGGAVADLIEYLEERYI